jgi:hypothetical protein
MKHIAPQFELPGTECAFNLAHSHLVAPTPAPQPAGDFDKIHPSTDHCDLFTRELFREQRAIAKATGETTT